MAKPIVMRINPVDAKKPFEISIAWSGNRASANRIIVYDNITNDVVFDDTALTYQLKHTIPADTLINGKKYVVQAQIYDMENTPSSLSDKVLFYTFETPEFRFDNIPENGKIANASFRASVYYNSSNSENISTYKFYLYDSTKKQLLESGLLSDSLDISYVYRGLDNNATYYIRCIGVTVNGMEVETGYVGISTKYDNLNTYARIYAKSLPLQGCVQVASNLIVIQYNGEDRFEYTDGMINLTDKTLYYDEGFSIEDDFTVIIKGINLWQNADIFKMSNGVNCITLSSRIYSNGKLRFRIIAQNGICNYLLYSDEQIFRNEDVVIISVRKQNSAYQIKTFINPGSVVENNLFVGGE